MQNKKLRLKVKDISACFTYCLKYKLTDESTIQELSYMRKGRERRHSSTQVFADTLNEKKDIELTEIKDTSYFENLSAVVQTNSTNQIANVLELQSGER
jgi:ABC-type uncharacterized transport system ATPase subunit